MTAPTLPQLTLDLLKQEARAFADGERTHAEPKLYGVTDGKAVGGYLEAKFQNRLAEKYDYTKGNAATGLDLPSLNTDIKTTSIKQPQSSSPFRSARQKIYGLGYSLLVFVYDKRDDASNQTAIMDVQHVIFVDASRTADYQMTAAINEVLKRNGNVDDLVALMMDRHLPVDDIEATNIANELLKNPPLQGYLTISNALQWRLQYSRVITQAGVVDGVDRL